MNQLSVTPKSCPHCGSLKFFKKGFFYKKITKTYIPRYRCGDCRRSFSTRTLSTTFKQKRPDLNRSIYLSLVSGTSLRKTAQNLQCSYLTVCRKFLWLAQRAKELHLSQKFKAEDIQFDEMESIEHTKLKPLTICLAVASDYRILGVKVGRIPAKGPLATISQKKYGLRKNESNQKTLELLLALKESLLLPPNLLKSDAKQSYKAMVKSVFPGVPYEQYPARRQKEKSREMKYLSQEKRKFDPLFALNQRCAKLRDHVKRLTRRSWCTTKIPLHLEMHLDLYIAHNNNYKMF